MGSIVHRNSSVGRGHSCCRLPGSTVRTDLTRSLDVWERKPWNSSHDGFSSGQRRKPHAKPECLSPHGTDRALGTRTATALCRSHLAVVITASHRLSMLEQGLRGVAATLASGQRAQSRCSTSRVRREITVRYSLTLPATMLRWCP